ncbi:porin [bacterium]|nr:porin [bacterium]MBU1072379.1 porin [bacterium]MBU1674386.1 porin [bacterium]
MEGTKRLLLLAGAVYLLGAGAALGAGFNIYEAGARATALGGAFTATADDGSAIFYNPAGLAFLEGSALDLNLMPIIPAAEFTGALQPDGTYASGKTTDQIFPIPGAYFYRNDGELTYGIGLYTPFGLGVEWSDPDDWIGRAVSYNVDLATIYVSPVVAWRVNEDVALSFGVDVGYTKIELKRRMLTVFGGNNAPTDVIDVSIDGDSKLNFTPSAGAMIKANEKLTFGVMYHHQKTLSIEEGNLELTNIAPDALAGAVDNMIAGLGGNKHTGSTELKLPHILSLAASYQLTEQARVEFDAVHFGWGHFDELALDFGSDDLNETIPESYEDVWQLRLGASYDVDDKLTLMGGYVRDKSPQPVESMSPLLPDANRDDFSLGVQYRLNERLTLTGTYMGVNFEERTNVVDGAQVVFPEDEAEYGEGPYPNPAGTYDSYADIFGVGISYRF